jgi:hypothetical protein
MKQNGQPAARSSIRSFISRARKKGGLKPKKGTFLGRFSGQKGKKGFFISPYLALKMWF